MGGWVADTASIWGDASIGGNASIWGDASIGGNASIGGDASIGGNADHLIIWPLGDHGLTLARTVNGHVLQAGCTTTTIPDARDRLADPVAIWPGHVEATRHAYTARWLAALDLCDVVARMWADEANADQGGSDE
jgi:hypothetical protein